MSIPIQTMDDKKLGNIIRERRTKLKLSQEDFGRLALGLSGSDTSIQKLVSKIESGKRKITAIEIYKIAKYLNVQTDDLFTLKESNISGVAVPCNLPVHAADICGMINEIFASSDSQIHDALYSNLVAFKNSATKDSKINDLERKVNYLMQLYDAKIKSGT
jgi:transcriptional regulator with XRE-family HTH domain